MIAAIMLYGTAIAAFFALAAFAAERAASALGLARRGVWALALLFSLIAPPMMMVGTDTQPSVALTTPSGTSTPAFADESAPPASSHRAIETAAQRSTTSQLTFPKLDPTLALLWAIASACLVAFYVAGAMHTRRRLRGERSGTIAGHTVVISDDIGPAVLGFMQPTVIVPQWLLETPPTFQSLVLEHERQHVKARDQLLLILGLLAVVIAPWNLPLWWQLRRLRFAIEVDCDARVIRKGADAFTYGEVLLQVGRQSLRTPMAVVALIEPPSDLERRIRIITADRQRYAAVFATACAALCASLVVVAAQIDPPRPDREDLRLPLPRETLPAQVQAVVREQHPELLATALAEPVFLKVILNNDLSIDWTEKTTLPLGTSHEQAEARERPSDALNQKLQADEPRVMGRFVMREGADSQPIYVSWAVHMFHESRLPAAAERGLKAKYPELYDDVADSNMLLIALMNDDGTVERAIQRPRVPGESLIGDENWHRVLSELNAGTVNLGAMAMIGSRKTAPFRPTVLYAFRKSDDPRLDADPTRPDDRARRFAIQRALVERHFPEIANGSTNPHALLWVLLNESGEVLATGREAAQPDPLMVDLERHYPGAATAKRMSTQLTALFGEPMRDTRGEPILITFAWLRDEDVQRARAAAKFDSLAVDTAIYRNNELVSSGLMTLKAGVPYTHTTDLLRLDITALDAGTEDLVDLGVVMRVPIDQNGVEFAEGWEIVSQPMVRTKLGAEAVIEVGVRSPSKQGDAIWRISLKPQASSG